ncbi:MAG: ribonuclease PH [Coriobacteriales bacterium]|jgi:ribonuclease PH
MTIDIGLGRSYGRTPEQKRPTKITRNFLETAAGSCLIETGRTKVICAVTIEERVPVWRKGSGRGWVTAEYAMMPASTAQRTAREYHGRKGRSMEIERLIGRTLRTVVDMNALGGEVTFHVDCDVLQADGGTRTASITGAWIALHDAVEHWQKAGKIKTSPLLDQVAAISVGVVDGRILLDLDYQEDSHAEVDLNLVMNSKGEIIEIQGTGEQTPFSREKLDRMLDIAQAGIEELLEEQRAAIEEA